MAWKAADMNLHVKMPKIKLLSCKQALNPQSHKWEEWSPDKAHVIPNHSAGNQESALHNSRGAKGRVKKAAK
jgi:hypothetical protein